MDEEQADHLRPNDFVKVAIRVRPMDRSVDPTCQNCVTVSDDNVVTLLTRPANHTFSFDHVAGPDATQESIFTSCAKTIIKGCVEGYNGTIFAYGQTGSGKTYTMIGPLSENEALSESRFRGVIPRSLEYLFALIEQKRILHGTAIEFLCKCSFIELYQEKIFDLLDTCNSVLQLRENMTRGVFVEGVCERTVRSATETIQVLKEGLVNRRIASTAMNRESSRSHAVFTLSIESKIRKVNMTNLRVSLLHLVDLAGSERQKNLTVDDMRIKEACYINKSLSVLGNVISALVSTLRGKIRHIPYRDSKLTFLLRNSLGGNSRTCLIANIHPNQMCIGETLSTLQFAQRTKLIQNRAVINEDIYGGNVVELREEIKRLQKQLRSVTHVSEAKRARTSPLHKPSDESLPNVRWDREFFRAMCLVIKYIAEKEAFHKMANSWKKLYQEHEKRLMSKGFLLYVKEGKLNALERSLNESSEKHDHQLVNDSSMDVSGLTGMQAQPPPDDMPLRLSKLQQENEELKQRVTVLETSEAIVQWLSSEASYQSRLWNFYTELQVMEENFQSPGGQADSNRVTEESLLEVVNEKKRMGEKYEQILQEKSAELRAADRMITELQTALEAALLQKKLMSDLHMSILKNMTPVSSSYPDDPSRTDSFACSCTSYFNTPSPIRFGSNFLHTSTATRSTLTDTVMEDMRRYQKVNAEVEDRLQRYRLQVVDLQNQLDKAKEARDVLELEFTSERQFYERLENEMKHERQTLTEELNNATRVIKQVETHNAELQSTIQLHEQDKAKLQEEIKRLEVSTQELTEQLCKVRVDLQDVVQDRDGVSAKLEEITADREQLSVENHVLNNLIADLNSKYLEENTLRNELEQVLHQMDSVTDGSSGGSTTTAGDLKSIGGSVLQKLFDLRREFDAVQAEKADLMTSVAMLEEEKRQLTEAIARDLQKQAQLNADLLRRVSETEKLTAENDDLKLQASQLLQTNDALHQQLKHDDERIRAEIQKRKKALAKEKQAKERVDILHNVIDGLKTNSETYLDEIRRLKQELSERSADMERAKADIKLCKVSLATKEEETAILNENVARLDKLLSDYETERRDRNMQIICLKDRVSQLETKVTQGEEWKAKCEQRDAEISRLNDVVLKEKEELLLIKEENATVQDLKLRLKKLEEDTTVFSTKLAKSAGEADALGALLQSAKLEIGRLQQAEVTVFNEKENYRSQLEELKECNANLDKKVKDLAQRLKECEKESAALAGHSNNRQKIHYLANLQKEKWSLLQENTALKEQLRHATRALTGVKPPESISSSGS